MYIFYFLQIHRIPEFTLWLEEGKVESRKTDHLFSGLKQREQVVNKQFTGLKIIQVKNK